MIIQIVHWSLPIEPEVSIEPEAGKKSGQNKALELISGKIFLKIFISQILVLLRVEEMY